MPLNSRISHTVALAHARLRKLFRGADAAAPFSAAGETGRTGSATPSPYRILFVCMGNICRSPIAEAVTRGLARQAGLAAALTLDSAGTHGHLHRGALADERARRVCARRGYDLSKNRARPVVAADFERFDRILAMDATNLAALRHLCPENSLGKVSLFLHCAEALDVSEMPDPYYGDESGFERVVDLCELAAKGLLKELARERMAPP